MLGENIRLNKHTTRSAAWIKHNAFLWLQHRNQSFDDAHGREVFTASFPFRICKLTDEILIHSADQIFPVVIKSENFFREKVDEACNAFPFKIRTCENSRKKSTELVGVSFLKKLQRIIQNNFDVVSLSVCTDEIPSCFFRNNESSSTTVFIRIAQSRFCSLRVFRVVVASWLFDQFFKLSPTLLVFQR